MIKIDMWYNDKKEQATGLDIWFNDLGCFYSGNITIFDKIVGDYYADSVQEICEALHDIFNLEYHETKDGSRAYNKVVDFVLLHPEYKKAFDSIYN